MKLPPEKSEVSAVLAKPTSPVSEMRGNSAARAAPAAGHAGTHLAAVQGLRRVYICGGAWTRLPCPVHIHEGETSK